MADFSFWRRSAAWPVLLALLAIGLAGYYYFTGEAATLPLVLVPHLAPVPLTLDSVLVGATYLPVPANGYVTTLTHDFAGPYTQPLAAALWLGTLAVGLAGWLAVVSMLRRPAFIAGTAPVIFLLMSLNIDGLKVISGREQGFLLLSIVLLGGAAFGLHAFGERVGIRGRLLVFGGLVAALVGLIFSRADLPAAATLLHLAAFATPAGAGLVAALVLWVGFENVRALLWFNTQAERPEGRFGVAPLVLASLLYLGALGFYYWNNGDVLLLFGLHLDPLVLLLPAVLVGGLGLPQRLPSYGDWVPFAAARPLYWLLVAVAAAALAYALATANTPLLAAAREFSNLALLGLGGAFLLYVLVNFGTLVQRRLRVYRVVFEPRCLPLYTVYVLGLSVIVLVQLRNNWSLYALVQAGQYNQLGDLTRLQSETHPDDLTLALLAERYYAESSDVLDRFNRAGQLGRAALYRVRGQRQNELNALRRATRRQPDAKLSLRLAALYSDPADFFEGLEVLRQSRRDFPHSAALTSDLAQFFTRSALTDSVAFYLDQTEKLAPGSYVSQTNQIAFLTRQGLLAEAQKLNTQFKPNANEPALRSNQLLLALLAAPTGRAATTAPPTGAAVLDATAFAEVYHGVLQAAHQPAQFRPWFMKLQQLSGQPENAPYYEQLLFLQALLLHGAGQEVAARQTLAPLTAGTSSTAAYYQYLLGVWQLQQGQYATAAAQLGLAAAHGMAPAYPARVWALAFSGQRDSARAVAQRLAAGPDSTQRPVGQQLAALAAPQNPTAPKQPVLGHELLAQARQAEPDPKQATKLYQQLLATAPFNEAAVLAAAHFYTAQRQPSDAYEALRLG
ncbi:MAG: hypothetical protein EOO59_01500, partial [Hymenobacter sp.]